MTWKKWLTEWLFTHGSFRGSRLSTREPKTRLQVETLEARNLPASYVPFAPPLENSSVQITLIGIDEDNDFEDDATYHFVISSAPTNGTLSIGAAPLTTGSTFVGVVENDVTSNAEMVKAVTYTPQPGFTGADSFTFETYDPDDPDNPDGAIITSATVKFDVIAPPVANNITGITAKNAPLTASFAATNPNGGALTYTILSDPSAGTVTNNNNGMFTFDPGTAFASLGLDSQGVPRTQDVSFTYEATETFTGATGTVQTIASSPATVTITVTGFNDAPTANDISTQTSPSAPITQSFNATDQDSGDTLTYTILTQPSGGSVTNNNDGTFTFNPGTDFQTLGNSSAVTSFTYQATDNHAADSNIATVSVTVTSVHFAAAAGTTPQLSNENTAFATLLKTTLLDGSGNAIVGEPETFIVNPASNGASGTFAGASSTFTANSDITGAVTASAFTANKIAGSYTVTVTSPNLPGLSVIFHLTNSARAPAQIIPLLSTQSATVHTAFQNLQVTVLDQFNNPVRVSITFTVATAANGASATFAAGPGVSANGKTATVTTNSAGVAIAPTLTANTKATVGAPYAVTASVTSGGGPSATFKLTNNPDVASALTFTQLPPSTFFGGNSYTIKVQLTDQFGNLVPLAGRSIRLSLSNGTVLGTAKTNASGSALFTLLIKLPGDYSLTVDLLNVQTAAIVAVKTSAVFKVTNRYRFGI